MADYDRDPFATNYSDSPRNLAEGTRRLCIVSGGPILWSPFMAALHTALRPHDELEIVVDRRRFGVPMDVAPHTQKQFGRDRRRNRHLDQQLQVDGFFLVPTATADVMRRRSAGSLGQMPLEDIRSEDPSDEDRLESVRKFMGTRRNRLTKWLVLVVPGFFSAVAVALVLSSSVESVVSRLRAAPASPQHLSTLQPHDELTSSGPARLSAAPSAELPRTRLREIASPLRDDDSALKSRELPASGGMSEQHAAARVPPNPRRTPIANEAIGPTGNTPPAFATPILAPRFPGLPVVEVLGDAAPATGGQSGTYAVRISDTAGRPLSGADVWILARMADGSVQSILLHAGPEPGTYRATVPDGPAPLDLRVAITTLDKRVEIPLSR